MNFRADCDFAKLDDFGRIPFGKIWESIVGIGVAMSALGAIAVGASVFVTLMTMVLLGMLMLLGGILQTVHAVSLRRWSGFYVDLIAGLIYAVSGYLMIFRPETSAVGLTLLLVFCLVCAGFFRIVVGLGASERPRPGLVFYGVLNLTLSYVIWHDWPVSGLWIIGLLIGIELLFNGWALIVLGLGVRELCATK